MDLKCLRLSACIVEIALSVCSFFRKKMLWFTTWASRIRGGVGCCYMDVGESLGSSARASNILVDHVPFLSSLHY